MTSLFLDLRHAVRVLARNAGVTVLAAQSALPILLGRTIPILPPDQYLALVVQATEGCSWNKCTFCAFYKDRPFHIKHEAELRSQSQGLATYEAQFDHLAELNGPEADKVVQQSVPEPA